MSCSQRKEWNVERIQGYDVFRVNLNFSESIANITFRWIVKNRFGAIVKEFKEGQGLSKEDKTLIILAYKESLPLGEYSHVLEYTNAQLTRPLLVGEYHVKPV
jgi:uncharacterized membrane protein YbaN (DUF454 family)